MHRLLAVSLTMLTLTISACTLSFSPSRWEQYTFDGYQFLPSTLECNYSIWVRQGYVPRSTPPPTASFDYGRLATNSGAVAGICYRKTENHGVATVTGTTPAPDEQIIIKNDTVGLIVTRTGPAGLFIEQLDPGLYQLFCRGGAVDVHVQAGQTTLVTIRGADEGKK